MFKFQEGFYSDVRIENRFTTQIAFRDGKLEESKSSVVKKAFIRVFDGTMWYYASTYRVDDLQGELDKLYLNATPNPAIGENATVKRITPHRAEVMKFASCSVKDVPIAQKQRLLTDNMSYLNSSEYIRMTMASYADRYSEMEFYSSKGASLHYDFQLCGVSFGYSLANETDNFSNAFRKTKDKFEDLTVTEEELKACVAEGENYLLNAKPVQPGNYPVILSPETAGVFAHESFGHKSEADFMIGDETMKKEWTIGKQVGSKILSIYDSGAGEGSGYCPFDDEGNAAGKVYLIRNGVLTGRLHSATTAAELDEQPTGNARAIDCNFEPIVRMTSTVIEAGDQTVDELFAGIEHGYFIKTYKHGSGMSTFTIAPLLAYEIVNGKIGNPVKIAVITGNVFETLNLIEGLSDQTEVISSIMGGCGKMEQMPLPVSFGGPYVKISKMTVQ